MKYGPDFICVGAQKAGTSWLYENLLLHPDTAMPFEKEINFFYPDIFKNHTGFSSKLIPLFSSAFYFYRKRTWGSWIKSEQEWGYRYLYYLQKTRKFRFHRMTERKAAYTWYKKYYFSERTIENYAALFAHAKEKITGDISPGYADMPDVYIHLLRKANPNAKIIYLLRNPVDRAWSQFKMENKLHLQDINENLKCFQQQGVRLCSHSLYSNNLINWEKHFPGLVKVWFYDQLTDNPARVFREICDFLGLTPNFPHTYQVRQKIFAGDNHPMPDTIKDYLCGLLREEIITLNKRFNNEATQKWCEQLS